MSLFHITTREAWRDAVERGTYEPPSLAREGFVHLSNDRQWLGAANRFHRGQVNLVLLTIREDRLSAPVRHEPADGDVFPHLYGALNVDAVVDAYDLPVAAGGAIGIPRELEPWKHFFVALCIVLVRG